MKKRVFRPLAAVLCLVMALSLFTPTLAAEPAADAPAELLDASWTHNFTTSGKTSSFYTITGNLSTSKGTVNYDGKTLTQCLKMESSTTITFTAPTDGTLTLVFADTETASIELDKVEKTGTSSVMTLDVAAGQRTLTKADTVNLFYMVYASKAAGPHDPAWDEGEVTKEPTCTETGVKTYKCTVSGCVDDKHVKTEDVATIPHTYENNGVYCTMCGRNKDNASDVHKEHTYGAWEVDKAASCTEEGSRHQTCTNTKCNKTVTETIPVTDHTYSNQGVCSVCGATKSVAAGGWFEALYAEMADVKPTDVTGVSWTGADEGSLSATDRQYLVRAAKVMKDGAQVDGVRIDVPGLKPGAYDLTVTTDSSSVTAKNITVLAHDRSGYAHWKYTDGVGAYKDDGTLKANAVVLYVTDANKNDVTLTVGSTIVKGIGNILNSKGKNDNGNNDILKKLAGTGKPLVVRIVGNVTAPAGVTAYDSSAFGGSKGDNGFMAGMKDANNVTIEGIGADAAIDGWGLSFIASTKGYGKSFEVRNITFRNVPEDCIGMEGGSQSGSSLTDVPVERCWIHNCKFNVPKIANPAENDKGEGDGACDFKRGQYMTMSYCHYKGYHKTNLVGSDDTTIQYNITWHHNWWEGCDQRGPLGRQANMHIYNNLYEGQTGYCMSLRGRSYVFSERNQFLDCTGDLVRLEATKGYTEPVGACKSWQDVFIGSDGRNDAVKVDSKDQTVSNTNKYPDFDTNATRSYIPDNNYKLDTVAEAKANIDAYAGVMKAAAEIVTPGHSHAWGEWQTVKAATCTEDGERKRTCGTPDCTVPGGVQTETIPAPGHDWGEWSVTKDPDCIHDGEETRECANCPEKETRAVDATGEHVYGDDGNCTTPGCTANNGAVPKPADSTALKEAILAAQAALDAAQVSTDAAFVLKSETWVTQAVKDAYQTAIGKAQTVADKTALTEAELQDAVAALSTATASFGNAKKPGAAAKCGKLGQLSWGVDAAGNLKLSGTGTGEEMVVAAFWDSGNNFLGAKLLTGSQTTLPLGGCAKVKLLWLGAGCAPKCEAATIDK